MPYRSTTLNEFAKRCPQAVDYVERNTPRDRRDFEAGTAAHAFLQSAGEATKLKRPARPTPEEIASRWDAVSKLLLETGRIFDGHAEPPLNPEAVFQGRKLADQYLRWNPEALSATAHYEIGFAVDASGKACRYDSAEARLIGVLDVCDVIPWRDEETEAMGIIVRDYKSAWSTDDAELETIQRKTQGVLAWRNLGGTYDFLTLQVVNLRTGKSFDKTIFVAEGLEERVSEWFNEIALCMNALDAMRDKRGNRPAIPSFGCLGCSWTHRCDAGQRFIQEEKGMPVTPEQRAENFALISQLKDAYADALREDTEEGPIALIGSDMVGTVAKPSVELADEAPGDMADRWDLAGGDLRGFAHSLDLSTKNLISMSKVLFRDDRELRNAFVEANTVKSVRREFGIHRNPEAKPLPTTQRTRRRSKHEPTTADV